MSELLPDEHKSETKVETKGETNGGVRLFQTMLLSVVAVAIAIAAGFGVYKAWPASANIGNGQQKIIVVDSKKILLSSTKQIMANKELTTEQIGTVSQKLAINMQKLIETYRLNGFIVINSAALLTWPSEIDETAKFADQLGIKIE